MKSEAHVSGMHEFSACRDTVRPCQEQKTRYSVQTDKLSFGEGTSLYDLDCVAVCCVKY